MKWNQIIRVSCSSVENYTVQTTETLLVVGSVSAV